MVCPGEVGITILLFDIFSCHPTEYPYWFGMLAPFGIIYLFNWTVFIIIMISVIKRTHRSAKLTVKEKSSISQGKKLVLIATGLSIVFGLGWGLGIISLVVSIADEDNVSFAFQVIFSILVGIQGVLIFIFHGVRSNEARKEWQSWLFKFPCLKHRYQGTWYTSGNSRDSHSTGAHKLSVTEAPTLKREPDKERFMTDTIKLTLEEIPESVVLAGLDTPRDGDSTCTAFTNPLALHLDPDKAVEDEEEKISSL